MSPTYYEAESEFTRAHRNLAQVISELTSEEFCRRLFGGEPKQLSHPRPEPDGGRPGGIERRHGEERRHEERRHDSAK